MKCLRFEVECASSTSAERKQSPLCLAWLLLRRESRPTLCRPVYTVLVESQSFEKMAMSINWFGMKLSKFTFRMYEFIQNMIS